MRAAKRKRHTHWAVRIAVTVLMLSLLGSTAVMQAKLNAARESYAALQARHALTQQETAELRDMAENGITDRYIQKVARQNGYVAAGEKILIDIYGK